MPGAWTSVRVVGVRVDSLTGADMLVRLDERVRRGIRTHLAYVNAHSVNVAHDDAAYRGALDRADLVLNDGVGIGFAGRLQGHRFPENLNGSDTTVRILELAARRSWRVALFGGAPGVAVRAAERLRSGIPGLNVVATISGFPADEASVAEELRAARPDVVVVARGTPLQEQWLDEHLDRTGAMLGLGVGAFLDLAAGVVPRAPALVRRARLEWAWRLMHEPRRLGRRYLIGSPRFLWRVVTDRTRAQARVASP